MRRRAEIAVLGGGIVGRAIAIELAQRGLRDVAVIDHGGLGGEASPAAAGVLPVASMRAPRGILFEMGRASLGGYPAFLEGLRERAPVVPSLRRPGVIELAASEQEASTLGERVRRRQSQEMRAEMIGPSMLPRLVPGCSRAFLAAALFPDDGWIEVHALLSALRAALGASGVRWFGGERACIEASGTRITGVRAGCDTVEVGALVVAAGWWSAALLEPLGVRLPLRPARGEMVELRPAGPVPAHVLAYGDVRMVPAPTGRAWIGATVDFDDVPIPSPEGRNRLLTQLASVVPGLSRADVLAHWAGVRPCSTVRRPIIDTVPGWENLFIAVGHHRSGVLLAPLTAAVVAALVVGGELPIPRSWVAWRPAQGAGRA